MIPKASIVKRLVLATALMLLTPTVIAASAQDWLMKIQHAAFKQNYVGVFVYHHDNQLKSMRIIHQVRNGKIRERIISLNGTPREIVRKDNTVWRYYPHKKAVVVSKHKSVKRSFPAILPKTLTRLGQNYSVRLGPVARIADRPAQQVSIMPKDKLRYGYRIWADRKTGLLLKAVLIDAKGRPIAQYMFAQISIGRRIPNSMLKPRTAHSGMPTRRVRAQRQGLRSGIQVKFLPKGFGLATEKKRYCQMHKAPVEQRVYSDGLAAVSVFVEAITKEHKRPMTGPNKMGAIHAFSRIVNNHQVTVVGQVPAATVRNICKSIKVK